MSYAFIDFETTGFIPEKSDRAVEFAAVLTDDDFNVVGEFETLINPLRDVGPTSVHGVKSVDVVSAPEFVHIAPGVSSLLDGHVVVGHNVSFDKRFLVAELGRCDESHDVGVPGCTMSLTSGTNYPRKLDELMKFLGVERQGAAHTALSDAYGSLGIARELGVPEGSAFRSFTPFVDIGSLPHLTRGVTSAVVERRSRFLTIPSGLTMEEAQYLDMLSDFLSDNHLDDDEASVLDDMLWRSGFNDRQIEDVHYRYLHHVIQSAAEDGDVDANELATIEYAASVLRLDHRAAGLMTTIALTEVPSQTSIASGINICMTGEYHVPRGELVDMAEAYGLTVKSGVSKKVDVLVCNDPTSQSGKAKKARELGINVMHYDDFVAAISGEQPQNPVPENNPVPDERLLAKLVPATGKPAATNRGVCGSRTADGSPCQNVSGGCPHHFR